MQTIHPRGIWHTEQVHPIFLDQGCHALGQRWCFHRKTLCIGVRGIISTKVYGRECGNAPTSTPSTYPHTSSRLSSPFAIFFSLSLSSLSLSLDFPSSSPFDAFHFSSIRSLRRHSSQIVVIIGRLENTICRLGCFCRMTRNRTLGIRRNCLTLGRTTLPNHSTIR